MLDKNDLKQIQKMINDSLGDFFENVLAPYFDRDHKETMGRFKQIDERFDQQDKEIDIIQRKLEENQEDHDEMFERLGRIEKKVDGHEKRIKKLELVTAS